MGRGTLQLTSGDDAIPTYPEIYHYDQSNRSSPGREVPISRFVVDCISICDENLFAVVEAFMRTLSDIGVCGNHEFSLVFYRQPSECILSRYDCK